MLLRARKDTKIALIRKVPLFSLLSEVQLARVASIADEIVLPKGTVLMEEGERGREFIVLVDGEVDVRRKGRKVSTLRAGDFVGEVSLVSGRPRNATVTATEPVRALVIRDSDFRALLIQVPQIALKVLEAFAQRLPPGLA